LRRESPSASASPGKGPSRREIPTKGKRGGSPSKTIRLTKWEKKPEEQYNVANTGYFWQGGERGKRNVGGKKRIPGGEGLKRTRSDQEREKQNEKGGSPSRG